MKNHPLILAGLALNILALGIVTTVVVSTRLKSDAAIAERSSDLALVAKHILADTCLKSKTATPFKLGDDVSLPGSDNGKSPTSCLYNTSTNQFIHLAYSNGQLIANQIYSRREVKNSISQIKQESKSNAKQ